jgi:Na+/H+ antiporter NhaA
MFYRWHVRPAAWVAVGLVLLILAAVAAMILLNRPDSRAYRDAVLVMAGVSV